MGANDTFRNDEYRKTTLQLRAIGFVVFLSLTVGTFFYHAVEKLTWLDSVYFCVVTLATVGYGDITPTTELGKAFTILYILLGVGFIATFASLMLKKTSLRREIKKEKARAKITTP